jgi:hypothetical protein
VVAVEKVAQPVIAELVGTIQSELPHGVIMGGVEVRILLAQLLVAGQHGPAERAGEVGNCRQ